MACLQAMIPNKLQKSPTSPDCSSYHTLVTANVRWPDLQDPWAHTPWSGRSANGSTSKDPNTAGTTYTIQDNESPRLGTIFYTCVRDGTVHTGRTTWEWKTTPNITNSDYITVSSLTGKCSSFENYSLNKKHGTQKWTISTTKLMI